jgi:hypothetical protein
MTDFTEGGFMETEPPPKDGDTESFACDGCGKAITTTWKADESIWVGDYDVTGGGMILHPNCFYEQLAQELDSAVENGHIIDMLDKAEGVASDLSVINPVFEGTEAEVLIPHIERWQKVRVFQGPPDYIKATDPLYSDAAAKCKIRLAIQASAR